MSRKPRIAHPDEAFAMGPVRMARYGKHVILETNWPEAAFSEMQNELAERLPDVVSEIDGLIERIVGLTLLWKPEKVLHRAWTEMAARHFGMESESDADTEDVISLRMLDYVQSVITSVQPNKTQENEIEEGAWRELQSSVAQLFNKLNFDYQLCSTALRRKQDPNFDEAYEELYFKAQIYWCNIRGHRYLIHEKEHFCDLLSPHSDVLERLFGLNAAELIDEFMKIQEALTKGIGEAFADLESFRQATMEAVESKLTRGTKLSEGEHAELIAAVIEESGWEEWQADVIGRTFGLDLFNLEKVTRLPKKLLRELAWGAGQDATFFEDGEFKGWPLRIWPIFKRPFISLDGQYYCFELYSLLDNLYRVLQKTVIRLDETYRQEWNNKQKEISEWLPFKYLLRLLPGATILRSVYYKWGTGCDNRKQWCEADGLVIYDDYLFIIEVKAGAFTYTSPANEFPAYIESVKNLIWKPATQGKRFVEYLTSETAVRIFNSEHEAIDELSYSKFRHIIIVPVSIDGLTELASQSQHLKGIGIDVGQTPVWAISLDDLRVYSDIFVNPLNFLHFVEQRMCAFASDVIKTEDELDHLGLYLKHNLYTQYATDMQVNPKADVSFVGYRADIDKYFTKKFYEPERLSPLTQDMPEHLGSILDLLAESDIAGRSWLAGYLLDLGGSWRKQIAAKIDEALGLQKTSRRILPISSHGETKLTICCWQQPFLVRNEKLAVEHARAAMVMAGEDERVLLELLFNQDDELAEVEWSRLKAADVPNADMARLQSQADAIRRKRLDMAGKVGRNAPCPCGSDKKYKKCCLKWRR